MQEGVSDQQSPVQQRNPAGYELKSMPQPSQYRDRCALDKTDSSGSQAASIEECVRSEEVEIASANYSFKKTCLISERKVEIRAREGIMIRGDFQDGRFLYSESNSILYTKLSYTYPSYST